MDSLSAPVFSKESQLVYVTKWARISEFAYTVIAILNVEQTLEEYEPDLAGLWGLPITSYSP